MDRLEIYKNIFLDIGLASELVPVVFGFIYLKKFIDTPIFWFIIFLLYNVLNEFAAGLGYVVYDWNTHLFYNIRIIIFLILLYWLYWKMLVTPIFKKWIILFGCVIIAFFLHYLFFDNFLLKYNIILDILGYIFLMIIILFCLVELLNASDLQDIKVNIMFYISLGFLFYLVIELPIGLIILTGWLESATPKEIEFFTLLQKISMIIGTIMYLIFAYGFYRARAIKTSNG